MRVAILTDEVGWHTRQLQQALRARGAVGRCVDLADCDIDTTASAHGLVIPGYGRGLPDAAIVRGVAGGSFEQVTKRLGVLHALQALGVPVYNEARAIERSVDKSMTSLLLHAAGVPTPPTWATESAARARRTAVREGAAGHALVMKPLFGSQGKGLQQVGAVDGTPHGEHRLLPDLADFGRLAYLQRFVPSADPGPGFDWRVLVIGGRAVAAMRRVSEHWIHNVAQGARTEAAELTPDLARLAEAASAALQMDYAGIDLIPSPGRGLGGGAVQVLEVNGVAAWRGLQRVTPFNIARALVDDLIDRKLAAAVPRRAARRA
ncbi:RimK family alpha-L-glutamate ligase [Sphaerotilus montanus]|uniref:RimK family alpha-L-glutamate ligase n=1 Tax=Sphaerotilus montanus TaxID=522889 RepID=A0A7Y9R1U1_9BURK|nr:RimK family alpha-L-glutamate ligase [Sphaerotilus montanus]NYG34089.1 RimK family alpha-L-glutamate ligase [Sphaerotilus montanus]NZD59228.1 RimK family alpha-L-glutamate ligase [Sphaerotilus montanus]